MTEAPTYQNGQLMPVTPRATALARTVNASLSASSELTLQDGTRFLRCYAISQDVYLRWGNEDCNASTFDEVIPAGQVVDVVLPDDKFGNRFTRVNFIERTASATLIVIEK